MQRKNLIGIAIATFIFSSTVLAQWHPEIDRVKTGKTKTKVQTIQSPRDAASGHATERRTHKPRRPQTAQHKLGNFEIQDIKSPRDVATGQAIGNRTTNNGSNALLEFQIPEKVQTVNPSIKSPRAVATGQVVAGQNSGGTITNQRRGGVVDSDNWGKRSKTRRPKNH